MNDPKRKREVFIGFDSAWTDSPTNPGAIAAMVVENDRPTTFFQPRLATFTQALRLTQDWRSECDYVLIAIDQPTIVPNRDGSRPVDRVAASLVSKLKGGVQPARQGGLGAAIFGENAPIWRFLSAVGASQNPLRARDSEAGHFLMEVFPALALPAIVPAIWQRSRAAKYNPRSAKFDLRDWAMVASGTATFARGLGANDLADWMDECARYAAPRKSDQDMLDAAICLTIALAWRRGPHDSTLLIGDEQTGYMATIASSHTRSVLTNAATKRGVAVDQGWDGTALRSPIERPQERSEPPPPSAAKLAKSVCPECGYQFKGNGFDGIDAHWRSKHEAILPYKEAWPRIQDRTYRRNVA